MKAAGWSQVEDSVICGSAYKYFSIIKIIGYNHWTG
jgi:hypothetical protein